MLGYTKVGRPAERFSAFPQMKGFKCFWFYCSVNWYVNGRRESMALNRYFTNGRNLIKCAVVGPSLSSSLFWGAKKSITPNSIILNLIIFV